MTDRQNFHPSMSGYDAYSFDGHNSQFTPSAEFHSFPGSQQMSTGRSDYHAFSNSGGNNGSSYFGGFAQATNMPQPRGQSGRRMNPDAPAFQPRQNASSQMSMPYQQQRNQGTGFAFNPFGYQSAPRQVEIRGVYGAQPHIARGGPLQYAQVAAASLPHRPPSVGPPPSFHQTAHSSYDNFRHNPVMRVSPDAHQQPMMMPYGAGQALDDNSGFDGSFGANTPQYSLTEDVLNQMQTSPNKCALFEVQIGLEQLISESHEFDTWGSAIRDRLTASEMQPEDLTLAARLIVEMAILGNECQYNFSKLCQLLDKSLNGFVPNHLKPQLMDFCQTRAGELTADNLRNLVSFLAELYDKIDLNGYRILDFGSQLIEQANRLLHVQPLNDQVVKTVVQVLKLDGRYLEDDQGPEVIEQLINTLTEAGANSRDISESAKNQIRQVKQLREKEWGVTKIDNIPSHYLPQRMGPNGFSDVLIFGPDGQPLTEEESAFLDECTANDSSPLYSGNEGLDDDQEVMEDYEKFLREQAEATAIRIAEKALEKLSVDEDDIPDTPKQTPEKSTLGENEAKLNQTPSKNTSS